MDSLPISVLVADGFPLTALGLSALVKADPELHLCGTCGDFNQLLASLREQKPQVIVLDFSSPGFSPASLHELRSLHPELAVVAITETQDQPTLSAALGTGVQGYVKKDCSLEEIKAAIVQAAAGNRFLCGQILERLSAPEDPAAPAAFDCQAVQLSQREEEIIALIAEGLTNSAIAQKLFISPHTVTTHRKNLMQKLKVNNTAGIVMYAVKSNLVDANKFLFSGS